MSESPVIVDIGKSKTMSLDAILESIPVGLFHYRLALICGAAFMADAMEVALLSFISTCAGIEWDLTSSQQNTITSLVFGGALLGSLFWGRLADYVGRRKSFIAACVLISSAGILSAASPSYPWLLTFRALVGFGIGGATVPFDLLAEFLPTTFRGTYLIYIEYFWTIGSLFVNGVAWLSLSSLGWRFLTYITAVPVSLAFIFGAFYLPESPRWLLVRGRREEAEQVLIDAANACNIHLTPFTLEQATHSEEVVESEAFIDLFRTREMRKVSLPLVLVWLCFGLSYYGIILFVTRLYSTSDDDGATCSFNYESIFINASAEIVGVFIAAQIIDSYGRIKTQYTFYLIGSIMMLILGMNVPSTAVLVIAWLGRLAAMASSSSTWVATPELFPTSTRATGHSICSSAARIGAFVSPYFVDSNLSILGVAFGLAIINGVAAFASYNLPETSNKQLDVITRSESSSKQDSDDSELRSPLQPSLDSL